MFAYGYAITTHKAQGGQWNKVLVLEERFPFDKVLTKMTLKKADLIIATSENYKLHSVPLAKNPRELLIFDQNIVGPFQFHVFCLTSSVLRSLW